MSKPFIRARRVVALAVLAAAAGCSSSGHVPPPPQEQLPRPSYSERPEGAPAREGVDARPADGASTLRRVTAER